ncbi:MAG: hypothetical protein KDJ65_15610 [Anaerolineae bacterium]|nr:hypothetical protein [Anaerolineae bacterium]
MALKKSVTYSITIILLFLTLHTIESLYAPTVKAAIDSDGDGVNDDIDAFPDDPSRAVICTPGYYGTFFCEPAQPGQYVAVHGALEPSLCPIGSFSDFAGAVSCQPAAPGYFVDSEGAASQTPCPIGSFSDFAGAVSCQPATPGYFVDSEGAITSIACPEGTYNSVYGAASCILAPIGTYVNTTAATAPTACPTGTNTLTIGSTSIDDCLNNSLADLPGIITSLGLSHGTENSLLAKVNNAQAALDRGDTDNAQEKLLSFVDEVKAQQGKKIDEDDANMLIEFVENILAQL